MAQINFDDIRIELPKKNTIKSICIYLNSDVVSLSEFKERLKPLVSPHGGRWFTDHYKVNESKYQDILKVLKTELQGRKPTPQIKDRRSTDRFTSDDDKLDEDHSYRDN